MRKLAIALLAMLAHVSVCFAQNPGNFPAGYVYGNSTATTKQPSPASLTSMFDRAFCSTNNAVPVRISGSWVCLTSVANAVWVTNGSGVPSLATTLPSGLAIPSPIFSSPSISSGTLTGVPNPSSGTDAANKTYVDAHSQGLNPLSASRLATAAVLPNTPTYANGAAGVGATLTAGSNTTLTVDGSVAALNDIILVKDQASSFQNGQYFVSTAGSGSAAWVITRCTLAACGVEYDTASTMLKGSYTYITAGSANIRNSYAQSTTVTTVGTDAVSYVLFTQQNPQLSVNQIFVGNASNIATGVAMSGDCTIVAAGAITCTKTNGAPTVTQAATMAALRALAPGVTASAYLTGFYVLGDGGEGEFVWSGASSATDDNGVVIQPNAGGVGRWIRATYSTAPNIVWWGAHCDWNGSTGTDDHAAYAAAVAWGMTANGAEIWMPRNCKSALASVVQIIGAPNVYFKGYSTASQVWNVGVSQTQCSSAIFWTGAANGWMFNWASNGTQTLVGGGMSGICLYGQASANKAIYVNSMRDGRFDQLYMESFLERTFHFYPNIAQNPSQPCDSQNNYIRQVYINNIVPGSGTSGDGLYVEGYAKLGLGGSNNGCNFSLNLIESVSAITYTGTALGSFGADNNRWINTTFGTTGATYAIYLGVSPTDGSVVAYPTNSEQFFGLTAGGFGSHVAGSMFVYGTGTYATSAHGIFIYGLDKGNGTPDPVVGSGATVDWITSEGYYSTVKNLGSVYQQSTWSTANAFDATGSKVTIANGSNAAMPAFKGYFQIDNFFDGSVAFVRAVSGSVAIIDQSGTTYQLTSSPGAGKIGIAFASSAYRIYNNTGGSVDIYISATNIGP